MLRNTTMGSGKPKKRNRQSEQPPREAAVSDDREQILREWRDRRDRYERERAQLCKDSIDVSARYDQWIVTLPGGALVLSVGFLEKIAPRPLPNTAIWLGCAWGILVASLLAAVGSLFTAMSATDRQIKMLDRDYQAEEQGEPRGSQKNLWADATKWFNYLSMILFTAGVSLLCTFAFKNFPKVYAGQQSSANSAVTNVPATIPPPVTNSVLQSTTTNKP